MTFGDYFLWLAIGGATLFIAGLAYGVFQDRPAKHD